MSRSALRRIVEAFFHRWPFYVMLFVLALGVGVLQVRSGTDEYIAGGSILTKGNSLVSAQSGLQNEPYYGFLSASQYTSQELVGLLFTDVFMESAAANADVELPTDPTGRTFTLQALRGGVSVWPSSGTIVHVTATTDDPELSADLATAVIEEYLVFKRDIDEQESGASEDFYIELAEPYRLELVDAQASLDAALALVDPEEGPTAAQTSEIDRLTEAEGVADRRYQDALRGLEQARLAESQAETDIEQRYTILDVPVVPNQPLGRRFDDVLVLAMYAVVGLLLTIIGPVFAALSNDVLVFADDLDPELGIGVVAQLPPFGRRQLDPSRAGPDVLDVPMEPPAEPDASYGSLVAAGAVAGGEGGEKGPVS